MPTPRPTQRLARPFVLSLALALTTAASAAHAESNAPALEMTRKDRLAVLYSNQVIFDRKGEPLVSVRVMDGQDKVRFSSRGRLTLLPSADDGARILTPPGASWTVTVEQATPGRVRWWVAAERLPAGDLTAAGRSRTRWQKAGHEVAVFESGALLGIAGRTLDTRSLTLAIDPRATAAEAEAHAEALAGEAAVLGEVIAESVQRPGGWIVARDDRTGLEIRARDLLWVTPTAGASIDVPEVEYGRGTARHGRADRRYAGEIYLAVGNDGRLAVVNLANAEALLEAVVPSEMPAAMPEEALKAQAVAARGQLLAKVGTRHRSDPYLLCADTHCQVYGGETREHARTTAAVRDTRGQLLFDERGLVDTVYSSCCGGHGEAFDQMWGGSAAPALLGALDVPNRQSPSAGQSPVGPAEDAVARFIDAPPKGAFCETTGRKSGLFRWTAERAGTEVSAAVNRLAPIGPVHTITVARRGRSGRALAVKYVGPKGEYVHKGEYANRKLLGHLKSGLWVVRREGPAGAAPARWTFEGGGHGHGVGMCQHGAIGQALQGRTFEQILEHSYPGGRLEKAW